MRSNTVLQGFIVNSDSRGVYHQRGVSPEGYITRGVGHQRGGSPEGCITGAELRPLLQARDLTHRLLVAMNPHNVLLVDRMYELQSTIYIVQSAQWRSQRSRTTAGVKWKLRPLKWEPRSLFLYGIRDPGPQFPHILGTLGSSISYYNRVPSMKLGTPMKFFFVLLNFAITIQ